MRAQVFMGTQPPGIPAVTVARTLKRIAAA